MTSPVPYRPNSPARLERQSAREIKRHAVIAHEDRTKALIDGQVLSDVAQADLEEEAGTYAYGMCLAAGDRFLEEITRRKTVDLNAANNVWLQKLAWRRG